MQLPLVFLDATAIEEIPLELWKEIFDYAGWPGSVDSRRFCHDDIRDSFRQDNDPSEGLLRALEAVHCLGTEEGREALLDAVHDRHVEPCRIPEECGTREFAARMFLLHLKDPSVGEAFVRAQVHAQAVGEPRSFSEFRGKTAKALRSVRKSKERLESLILAHCKSNDLGDHVQVNVIEDDGTSVFQVFHSYRTKKPLAIVRDSSARSMIEFRPVHCDVIRYEAVCGRLQVASRSAPMARQYVRLVGEALFSDPAFFAGDAACTLRPLQERGKEALEAHDLPGVGRVVMTECTWERGDRSVLHLRSRDCFRDIEDLKLPLKEEGTLINAKLKVQVADRGTRPVTVAVRVPSRIKISNPRHEPLVNRYLEAIGIRTLADPTELLDLWSLHPWRQPVAAWRAVLGDRVDELVREGVLSKVILGSVRSPGSEGAGRDLEVHEVSDGEYYGVAKEPEFESRSLSVTDVEGLELDASRFQHYLRGTLGLTSHCQKVQSDGLVDLGPVRVGEHEFRPVYLLRTPEEGFGTRLRSWAAGADIVLLLPPGRVTGSELPEGELACAVPSRRELERTLVVAGGLEECLPAIFSAPDGARLVVDTSRGVVWVDGIEIAGLTPGTQPFKFVMELASVSPRTIDSTELSRRISPARDDGSTPARHAKSAAKTAIAESLAKSERELEVDPFPSAGGSYRCTLAAFIR